LGVGRTRIVYRLTTNNIEIVVNGPHESVYKKQREKFAEVRRSGEFFYTRQGGKQQRGKDERYKPKIRRSNSRKKAALTLDIDG
jgi:hypothetical protein